MIAEIKIVFVCLGNICRSPTAEAVMRNKLIKAGLFGRVAVDSAGTSGYHVGSGSDSRSQLAAAERDIDMSMIRSRQIMLRDYQEADYLLAMDRSNLDKLIRAKPADSKAEIKLLMEFAEKQSQWPDEVPDPYYGGEQGFENVLDMIEDACDGLLRQIQKRLA